MWLWFVFASIVKFFSTARTESVAMCFLLRRKKKKKSDGIKSFYVQNDLGKDEVSSAHSILVASSGEVGVASRMNSRVSDWWDEPEGCWEVYPDLQESVSGEWGLPPSRVDCNHCIITCLLCLNQKRIMVEGLYSHSGMIYLVPSLSSLLPLGWLVKNFNCHLCSLSVT